MTTSFIPGVEGFNFNAKTKLGVHLDELFGSILTRVREHEWFTTHSKDHYKQLRRDLHTDFAPKGRYAIMLEKILREDMGFAGLGKINRYDPPAVMFLGEETEKLQKTALGAVLELVKHSGAPLLQNVPMVFNQDHLPTVEACLAGWKILGNSFNPDTGLFLVSKVDVNQMAIKLRPSFCIPIDELFLNEDESTALTAREISAIYIHEIGHVIDHMVRFADGSIVSNLVVRCGGAPAKFDAESISKMQAPTEVQLREVSEVCNTVADHVIAAAAVAGDTSMVRHVSSAVKLCTSALDGAVVVASKLDEQPEVDSTVWGTLGYILKMIFVFVFDIIAFLFKLLLLLHINSSISLNMTLRREYDTNAHTGIYSQVTVSKYTNNVAERSADSYAIRLGYGSELLTSLGKLSPEMYPGGAPISGIGFIDAIANALHVADSFISFETYVPVDDLLHREGVVRMQNVLNETYRFFRLYDKNTSDPVFYEHMRDEVKKIEKFYRTATNSGRNTKFAIAARELFAAIASPFTFIPLLVNGNISKDYDLLFRQVDMIRDNSFHYLSEELSRV